MRLAKVHNSSSIGKLLGAALATLLMVCRPAQASQEYAGEWCSPDKKHRTSWIVAVRSSELQFNEGGVCEIEKFARKGKWGIYTCIVRDESIANRIDLKFWMSSEGRLIFSSDDPELYDWVPRVLAKCED